MLLLHYEAIKMVRLISRRLAFRVTTTISYVPLPSLLLAISKVVGVEEVSSPRGFTPTGS